VREVASNDVHSPATSSSILGLPRCACTARDRSPFRRRSPRRYWSAPRERTARTVPSPTLSNGCAKIHSQTSRRLRAKRRSDGLSILWPVAPGSWIDDVHTRLGYQGNRLATRKSPLESGHKYLPPPQNLWACVFATAVFATVSCGVGTAKCSRIGFGRNPAPRSHSRGCFRI